jgi:hypothetical protein
MFLYLAIDHDFRRNSFFVISYTSLVYLVFCELCSDECTNNLIVACSSRTSWLIQGYAAAPRCNDYLSCCGSIETVFTSMLSDDRWRDGHAVWGSRSLLGSFGTSTASQFLLAFYVSVYFLFMSYPKGQLYA